MKITNTKFPCVWQPPNSPADTFPMPRSAIVEFKLGMGPCGKLVTDLEIETGEGFVNIGQRYDDGSATSFAYQLHQVVGRIEVESRP